MHTKRQFLGTAINCLTGQNIGIIQKYQFPLEKTAQQKFQKVSNYKDNNRGEITENTGEFSQHYFVSSKFLDSGYSGYFQFHSDRMMVFCLALVDGKR